VNPTSVYEDHYELSAHDNQSYFYEGGNAPACEVCGLVTDPAWVNDTFRLNTKKRALDLSATYDGAFIASPRLSAFVADWPGVLLDQLKAEPGFHRIRSTCVLPFDESRGQARRFEWCAQCGRFKQIAGSFRACLAHGTLVPDGLCATSEAFGSAGDSPAQRVAQSRTLIINAEYASLLLAGSFRGLDLGRARCGPPLP
jgi:hypothetical protein